MWASPHSYKDDEKYLSPFYGIRCAVNVPNKHRLRAGWLLSIRHHLKRRRFTLPPNTSALFMLTGGFASLITLGTLLLLMPLSTVSDEAASFRLAIFTATSAACVTGLVLVNTGTYWSGFGQFIIASLMFLGGIGIMTAGGLLLIIIGKRLTLADRLTLREPIGAPNLGQVSRLVWQIVLFAFAIQIIGSILFSLNFQANYSVGQATWHAIFHSVSAFNNAGFSIIPNSSSLASMSSNFLFLSATGVLIILGGISFAVIIDLSHRKRPNRWSLDTKLVLLGSLILWMFGAVTFFLLERSNLNTIGSLPIGSQILTSLFQSVSGRTAGFSTIDFGLASEMTRGIYMLLMFIGGTSASTAGGIKIGTFMILVIVIWSSMKGREHPEAFRRELPTAQVARAVTIIVLATGIILILIVSLSFTEASNLDSQQFKLSDVLFELISAFSTNGLSSGVSPSMTPSGQYVLIIAMYLGRVGPLALALGLALGQRKAIYRYTQETIRIG